MTKTLKVGTLVERLRDALALEVLAANDGFDREITTSESASPGLVLAGFVGRFLHHRVQVMGETEISYLNTLADAERARVLAQFFSYPLPIVFITKGLTPSGGLIEAARAGGVAVVRSALKTSEFYKRLNPFLEAEFAPMVTLHGSLADVFGVGLFFTGKSGIGKSECVLDLVERGHRLVADDLVICTRKGADILIGRGHELSRHYMEIRGVGLIDVPAIFGIRAVRQQKRLEVVVELHEWREGMPVERTGLDIEQTTILDVALPKISVPLNPGKNITVISEVIAMNHLLRYSGVNAAESFNKRLLGKMSQQADVKSYLQDDDE